MSIFYARVLSESKYVEVKVMNCKSKEHAKKIAFSIANSPLVKTAITGEDPNWAE